MRTVTVPANYTPRPYQVKMYNCIADGYKRGVAVWHRRAGKDLTLLSITAKEAFKRIGTYFYFYPEFKQGRKAIWDGFDRDGVRFISRIPDEVISRKVNDEMKIELINGSIIQIVGTDNIDSIMSSNPIGCVFAEYSLQKPQAWDFVRPILLENGGWALFNFTPRGLNHGWDIYKMASKDPKWFCEKLTIEDTGAVDMSLIDQERNEGVSDAMIRQEYYCDFNASSDDVVIPLDLVIRAAGKQIHPTNYMDSPKVLAVDVARFGDDESCIVKRQGLACYGMKSFRGLDNMQLANTVAHEINEWGPDAVFIDAGRGEGVIDRLRQLGHKVMEINFGGKSSLPGKFINKRAEMWWNAREWLEQGGCIPDDSDLRTQLSMPTYSFDRADRIQILSKDKIKEEFGCSPDRADALCLTFAMPVSLKVDRTDDRFRRQSRSVVTADYNPLTHGMKTAQTEYNVLGQR